MTGLKIKASPSAGAKLRPKQAQRMDRLASPGKRPATSSWTNKSKEAFYMELSVLVAAGVDIKTSLELVAEKRGRTRMVADIKSITEDVIKGFSLSKALERRGCFSAYEFYSIQIGEESGRVEKVLTGLAEHFRKRVKLRRQILQALSYPVVVLMTALSAVIFLMRFIVPMFSEVFSRFGGELPVLTVTVINMAAFLETYSLPMILTVACLCMALLYYRNKEWLRYLSSKILLSLPIVGEMVRAATLARMCEALSLLVAAKTPLVQAIGLVRQMCGSYAVEKSLQQVEADLLQGESLYGSLSKFPIYDARLVTLVKIGEESNKLDYFFDKLSTYYVEDLEHKSAVLGTVLEPVIIVFLGIVVGVVLLAMYLPMFELSNSFQ